jgi:hypothetical protein
VQPLRGALARGPTGVVNCLWLRSGVRMRGSDGTSIVSVRGTTSFFAGPVLVKWERGPEASNTRARATPESGGSRSVGGRVRSSRVNPRGFPPAAGHRA